MCQALSDKILVIALIQINEFLKGCCPEEILERHLYSSALPFPALGVGISHVYSFLSETLGPVSKSQALLVVCVERSWDHPSSLLSVPPHPDEWISDRNSKILIEIPRWPMSVLDKSGHFCVLENQASTVPLQLITTAREPWLVNWKVPGWPRTAFGRRGKESKLTEHLYVILFNFLINSVKAGVAPPGNFLFIGFFLYSKFPLWKISNSQK